MRSFLRFLISIFVVLGFFIFLLLTTIRFQILDTDFFTNNLDQEGVYKHSSRALRLTFKNLLREVYIKEEGVVLEELTVGERSQIEKDINKISNVITEATLKDFLESNILKVLSFVNGEEEQLLLYLPIKKWGFPDEFVNEEPMSFFSENTQIESILVSYGYDTGMLEDIKYYRSRVEPAWIVNLGILLVLITFHHLLETGENKISKTGLFLIKVGVLYVGLCLFAKVMADYLDRGIYYWKEPLQILASAMLPPFIEDILKLWIVVCVTSIVFGIVLLVINYGRLSRKKIKEEMLKKSQAMKANMKQTLSRKIV